MGAWGKEEDLARVALEKAEEAVTALAMEVEAEAGTGARVGRVAPVGLKEDKQGVGIAADSLGEMEVRLVGAVRALGAWEMAVAAGLEPESMG